MQVVAGTQPVNNVELYVDFDPAVLQVVDAAGNPTSTVEGDQTALNTVLFNAVDNAGGHIRYDAGKLSGTPPTGTFRLAVLRFKVLASVASRRSLCIAIGRVLRRCVRRWDLGPCDRSGPHSHVHADDVLYITLPLLHTHADTHRNAYRHDVDAHGDCDFTSWPNSHTHTHADTDRHADTAPPEVHWVAPVSDAQVYTTSDGIVQLEASATDSSGIHHVTFNRWDAVNLRTIEIGADYSPPYQASLDVSALNMGWNRGYNAEAVDNAGNWATQHIWIIRADATTGVVEGTAFHDANNNGVKDLGEAELAGAVMVLKLFPVNTESYTATSGADGAFRFVAVAPGQYTLSEKSPPPGYLLNTQYTLNLQVQANGTLTGFDIGHQAQSIATLTATPTTTPTVTRTATLTLTPAQR